MRKILIAIGVILVVALLGVGGYFLVKKLSTKSTTLTIWTLSGTESGVKAVADQFAATHPDVGIKIVPVPEQVYEFKSLYSLASQKGSNASAPPDVWIIPNEWLALDRSKLVAAPDGSLDDGIHAYKVSPTPSASPKADVVKGRSNLDIIKQDYGPVATNDLSADNKVWGVPLNSDTLALYYNKSLIAQPPKTWQDLINITKQYTQKNGSTVNRSVVALGDDATVNHGLDVLTTLMLQNGTEMVRTKDNISAFNLPNASGAMSGASALDFYTSFMRSDKETYTWNTTFGSSLSALASGKTMMAFGYAEDAAQLKGANIAVAPMPQVDSNHPQTYGRYLAATVTKQTSQPDLAWQLVSLFANPDLAKNYAQATNTIPARLDTAKDMTLDARAQVFQAQTGHTTDWQKKEVGVADSALDEALSLVLKDHNSASNALDVAAKTYTGFLQADSGIPPDPKMLSVWQSSDDAANYKVIVDSYLSEHKEIPRVYGTRRDPSRLEWELLNAGAAHQGPDVAIVPGDQVARLRGILNGFPKGAFNPISSQASDQEALRRLYVPAVAQDNYIDNILYGIPANVETLTLVYNTDLYRRLDQTKSDAQDKDYLDNIVLFSDGPLTWNDLKKMASIATARDGDNLKLPFVALGSGSNVAHVSDIYAAFTKQAGGDINDPDRIRSGIQLPISSSDNRVPGQEALSFIQSFSDPKSNNYSWNGSQENSLDAFADGKVMTAFVYPRDIAKIQKRNPAINFKFFPLPQVDTVSSPVDEAGSFSLTIPRGSSQPKTALQFIQTALKQGGESGFIGPTKTDNTPAAGERNASLGIQRFQANTAESYYKGYYPSEIDQTIIDLIDKKLNLDQAATKINQSLAKQILVP